MASVEIDSFCDRTWNFSTPNVKEVDLLTESPGIASTRSWPFCLPWMSCAVRLTQIPATELSLAPRTFQGPK